MKNIVFLENDNRKVVLHLYDGRKEEFYGSLKEVYEEQLKERDFLFIHNSYVVNYDYVAALKFDQVLLIDNAVPLPISKQKKNEVRAAYYEIVKRRDV